MEPEIIYEDSDLLVLNKPAGWVTTSADTAREVPIVQKWLEKRSYPIAKSSELRSGLAHRLDKDTSGCLLVGKTEESFRNLQKQFAERTITKTYVALAHGKMKVKKGTVKAEVGRLPWNRERFGIVPGGRDSETGYEVVEEYQKEKEFYTLVKLSPKTGRTHQIRIHLKFLGHPIVSDTFYAGRKTSKKDLTWCPRLFLHAVSITLNHPETGKQITYTAPLPTDLSSVLTSLVS